MFGLRQVFEARKSGFWGHFETLEGFEIAGETWCIFITYCFIEN
jgi:hypothetical protein